MTPREKILSFGVGGAILFAVGNYAFNSIIRGFRDKQSRIESLVRDIAQRDTSITDGIMDRNKLTALTPMSLPSNSEQAVADYHEWLIDLIETAQLKSPDQKFIGEIPEKGIFKKYKFSVVGRGTIENLTKLLYTFYEKNYLHRIASLKISPVPREPYQLDITMTMDVLGLDVASATQSPPSGQSHRIKRSLAEYNQDVVGRNLFSSANQPPRWSETGVDRRGPRRSVQF